MEEFISNNAVFAFLAPFTIIIVESLKRLGVDKKYSGIYSIFTGVILSFVMFISNYGFTLDIIDNALFTGILLGGSASGIFSQIKNIKK